MPLFAGFRAALLEAGVADAEADRRLQAVQRLMRARPDGWATMFDNIYTAAAPGFSTAPNALLAAAVAGRAPGRALDVGMGQGRNALFLARAGWTVTGFDLADAGLRRAREDAARAGLSLAAVRAGRDDFDYGVGQWELVVLAYEPLPAPMAPYVERLRRALTPGGLLVLESFASEGARARRRPVDVDPAELRAALGGWRVHRFDDAVATPDWGDRDARLVRAVAERRGEPAR
jgi:SAM-dependent methyltransferase